MKFPVSRNLKNSIAAILQVTGLISTSLHAEVGLIAIREFSIDYRFLLMPCEETTGAQSVMLSADVDFDSADLLGLCQKTIFKASSDGLTLESMQVDDAAGSVMFSCKSETSTVRSGSVPLAELFRVVNGSACRDLFTGIAFEYSPRLLDRTERKHGERRQVTLGEGRLLMLKGKNYPQIHLLGPEGAAVLTEEWNEGIGEIYVHSGLLATGDSEAIYRRIVYKIETTSPLVTKPVREEIWHLKLEQASGENGGSETAVALKLLHSIPYATGLAPQLKPIAQVGDRVIFHQAEKRERNVHGNLWAVDSNASAPARQLTTFEIEVEGNDKYYLDVLDALVVTDTRAWEACAASEAFSAPDLVISLQRLTPYDRGGTRLYGLNTAAADPMATLQPLTPATTVRGGIEYWASSLGAIQASEGRIFFASDLADDNAYSQPAVEGTEIVWSKDLWELLPCNESGQRRITAFDPRNFYRNVADAHAYGTGKIIFSVEDTRKQRLPMILDLDSGEPSQLPLVTYPEGLPPQTYLETKHISVDSMGRIYLESNILRDPIEATNGYLDIWFIDMTEGFIP